MNIIILKSVINRDPLGVLFLFLYSTHNYCGNLGYVLCLDPDHVIPIHKLLILYPQFTMRLIPLQFVVLPADEQIMEFLFVFILRFQEKVRIHLPQGLERRGTLKGIHTCCKGSSRSIKRLRLDWENILVGIQLRERDSLGLILKFKEVLDRHIITLSSFTKQVRFRGWIKIQGLIPWFRDWNLLKHIRWASCRGYCYRRFRPFFS